MADIFQQELDSPEGQEPTDESTPTELEPEPKIEEASDEDEDKNSNWYYLQTHTLPTLEELANSDYIHNRQLAAKKILESLQRAGSNQDELQSIISVMCKLSEDEENIVRSELVQHIPSIALFCQGHPSGLKLVIQQQLVPYTVKLLNDSQIAVRKLAQSALLVLLENNLIGQLQLSEWICPLISQLAMCESNLEEQRIEDVTVMSMMIPLVEKSMAVKFFLDPYISLCCDPAFGIRTVCAMRFGTLCKIAGTERTELSLLPSFVNLCSDDLWGVRKACADVFVDVATVVSLKTRNEVLPHIFINLLNDTSRYVKYAAYQSLGGFIGSFADPLKTGCSYFDGKLCVDESFFRTCPKPVHKKKKQPTEELGSKPLFFDIHRTNIKCSNTSASEERRASVDLNLRRNSQKEQFKGNIRACLHINNKEDIITFRELFPENTFNNFQYWRTPLPEVELDINMDGGKTTDIHVRAKLPGDTSAGTSEIMVHIASDETTDTINKRDSVIPNVQVQSTCINSLPDKEGDATNSKHLNSVYKTCQSQVLTFDNKKLVQDQETLSATVVSESNSSSSEEEEEEILSCDQDIVPSQLLSKYIATADHNFSDERIEYTAFSFPAVAFTLGRKYWPCIRSMYKKLACDMKWSVRCAIASSLHELAIILGHDLTVRDLLPIFLDYLGEVDDVRIRLVAHLPQFLQQLSPSKRWYFLPSLEEFTRLYNDRNWRFRCALAEQLQLTAELYFPFEIYKYFLPVALSLLQDRVSAVRVTAAELMAVIIKHLFKDEKTEAHCKTLLSELDSTYRQGNKWIWRQTYVLLCDQLAKKRSLPAETFLEELVPKLFSLGGDVVPNVRLAVSRCLAQTLLPLDYLPSIQKAHYELLLQVMYSLQGDIDEDVRHFARLSARAFSVLPEKKLSPV